MRISFMGKRKKKTPMAEYRKSVSRFPPRNPGERNSSSGTTGFFDLLSTHANNVKQIAPPTSPPMTTGFLQPKLEDSMKPTTSPPTPRVTSRAPDQSNL